MKKIPSKIMPAEWRFNFYDWRTSIYYSNSKELNLISRSIKNRMILYRLMTDSETILCISAIASGYLIRIFFIFFIRMHGGDFILIKFSFFPLICTNDSAFPFSDFMVTSNCDWAGLASKNNELCLMNIFWELLIV